MKRDPIREAEIKAKVLDHLRESGVVSAASLIANEFKIARSSTRADLAILADEFIGIEIKSDADSLRRLSLQVCSYLEVFDRVIVVLASKHFKKLNFEDLTGAEVWELTPSGEISPRLQPLTTHVKVPLEELMTQTELRRFGLQKGLFELDYDATDIESVRVVERGRFASVFRYRFGATSEQFWQVVSNRRIHGADMSFLSRYERKRRATKQLQVAQTVFWQEWALQAERMFGASREQYRSAES